MRRSLALLLLALALPSAAALPEGLSAALTALEGSTAGGEELTRGLQTLQDRLTEYGRTLDVSDRRRARVVELAAESALLKTRAAREGVVFREIQRDVIAHVGAVRALDGQPVPSPVRIQPAGAQGYLAHIQEGGVRALALAQGDVFGLRDGPNEGGIFPGWRFSSVAGGPQRPTPLQYTAPGGAQDPVTVPAAPQQEPLRRGSPDEARVTAIQTELNVWRRAAGYRILDTDGDFGPKTFEAVTIFQRDNGLEQTGVVDAATEAALRRAAAAARAELPKYVQHGDNGAHVEHVQMLLNRVAGYRRLQEDGDFGGRTQRALRAFQRAHRLPPSGHVDRPTLEALEAAAAARPASVPRSPASALLPAPAEGVTLYATPRMPAAVSRYVAEGEARYGIEANVYRAVVWAEGGSLLPVGRGNGVGAYGPSQITQSGAGPCIGRQFGGSRVTWQRIKTDWAVNVDCGAYLFKQRWNLAGMPADAHPLIIASTYNTRARNWDGIIRTQKVPQIRETTQYVTRISRIFCQWTGRQLLVPNRHLHVNATRQWAWALDADRDMVDEIEDEGRAVRPGCAHPLDAAARAAASAQAE
jgi:peptidoglycan hydrolase-like protein with peptidoglycan-binding domain